VRISYKGVGRKFSRGGANEKKDQKLAKKYRKITQFSLFGGATEKKRKIAKKGQKTALLSLYLLYLYHV